MRGYRRTRRVAASLMTMGALLGGEACGGTTAVTIGAGAGGPIASADAGVRTDASPPPDASLHADAAHATEAGSSPPGTTGTSYDAPNVVLLIADDMGGADLGLYAQEWGNTDPTNIAHTPNIDELAAAGVRFRNFYTNPICSPTRGTIYTGRYGCETSIGDVISPTQTTDILLSSETTIAQEIADAGGHPYADGLFGKWHLGMTAPGGGLESPVAHGFAQHVGVDEGEIPSFTNWTVRTTTSATSTSTAATTEYATRKNYEDAIAFVSSQVGASAPSNPKRFVLTMAFNAPHTPFHIPPDDPDGSKTYSNANVTSTTDCTQPGSQRGCYLADEEALDFYIGRLIRDLGAMGYSQSTNTMFIFMSDNGSPASAKANVIYNSALTGKGKDTAYEGGVREPLIIAGPRVATSLVGGKSDALVNSADLFATIGDLVANRTGATSLSSGNSVSVVPYIDGSSTGGAAGPWKARSWVYVDDFDGSAPYTATKSHEAVRDASHKYIIDYASGTKSYGLYDLSHIHEETGSFVDWEASSYNLVDPSTGALTSGNAALASELSSLSSTMAGIQAGKTSALP